MAERKPQRWRRPRRLQPQDRDARRGDELLRRHGRRERERKHNGRDHADRDQRWVEPEGPTQLGGEHAVDRLGQDAHLCCAKSAAPREQRWVCGLGKRKRSP